MIFDAQPMLEGETLALRPLETLATTMLALVTLAAIQFGIRRLARS